MSEQWKPVPGYEGLFEISDMGNIRSLDKPSFNRWGPCVKRGKSLNAHHDAKGYLQIRLWRGSKDDFKSFKVHRLVAAAFIPNPDNLAQVNHLNGIKDDNRAVNLAWCDNSENQLHANATGLRKGSPKGGDNHMSKIVLHLSAGVFYDSAREAYNHSERKERFEMFCKNIRNNKNYTYGT